ncbi:MAG TPA: hypothetical protein QF901_06520 [Gammaproteobacteria bacterium]|jgi:hypothetical protein|nr:hypothetical protein [Candidatus Hydrogenedentota bacterium]HJP35625.1 hypothetical protein [Gammaproteobacteria bacterium]
MLAYLAAVGILVAVVSVWAYLETHLPSRLEGVHCHGHHQGGGCEDCAQQSDACALREDTGEDGGTRDEGTLGERGPRGSGITA